jgi:dynein heavy chain 1
VKKQADEAILAWDSQLAVQRAMLSSLAKRRNEKLRALHFDIDALKLRLSQIAQFREQHEKLVGVFGVVLKSSEGDLMTELQEAFRLVVRVENDVFDLSPAGAVAWSSAEQLYDQRLEHIEVRVIMSLEEKLNTCKTADEMFRIFATYNPLFFRAAIRNAVNSFRSVLVKNVREDVRRLKDKFRLRYDDSLERTTADLRDIPPLSGRIIWARQIENQLSTLMQRMENVLGAGWEDQFEGKQLKEVCDELRSNLDTNALYRDWLTKQLTKTSVSNFSTKDFLFLVEDDSLSHSKSLTLNFDNNQVSECSTVG